MAHKHQLVSFFTILIIAPLVLAQNITEQNSTLPIITTISSTTTTTTVPNSTKDDPFIPTENTTIIAPEPNVLQGALPSSEKPPDTPSNPFNISEAQNIPPDCSRRQKNKKQPINSQQSRIRKCCPLGKGLESVTDGACKAHNFEFQLDVISVALYADCIEDLEIPVKLDIEVGNPCEQFSIYSTEDGDQLAVIQDGSLLLMDRFFNDSYAIQKNYCLDTNISTGEMYAIVCVNEPNGSFHLAQTILNTSLLIASIVSLCWVSWIHFKAKLTIHNLSLGVMSICMAVAFTSHIFAQFLDGTRSVLGLIVQFFMLSYFFWMFCLCSNIALHVCYILPNICIINHRKRSLIFNTYCLIAFSVPFALVLWTNANELPGMPYYYFKGFTDDSVRESQLYFIPPVSIVLMLCFVMLVASFVGYRHLIAIKFFKKTYEPVHSIHVYDQETYRDVKKDAKRICCLYVVTIISWFFLLITFYMPGSESNVIFLETINSLQGVFILMIFVLTRRGNTVCIPSWLRGKSQGLTAVPTDDPVPLEDKASPKRS